MNGELAQLDNALRTFRNQHAEFYKNLPKNYNESLVKLTSLEMSQSDLVNYAKALDSAIMKFHSVKMEEINKIIRELWTNTYQGTDIDTIEIRSETDTTAKNRSYNYRVNLHTQIYGY